MTVQLRIDKATGSLLNAPIKLLRGGLRPISLTILDSQVPGLLAAGSSLVFEIYLPSSLEQGGGGLQPKAGETYLAGGRISAWATSGESYTASLDTSGDLSGNLLGLIELNTLYARVRHTEPGQPEVVGPFFHVIYGAAAAADFQQLRWEQIQNPPQFPTVTAASDISRDADANLPGTGTVQAALDHIGTRLAGGDADQQQLDADQQQLAADLASHEADQGNPHAVTKAHVGLGDVDNTADSAKPVSATQQAALDAKADRDLSNAHSGSVGLPLLDAAVTALLNSINTGAGYIREGQWDASSGSYPVDTTGSMAAYTADRSAWYVSTAGTQDGVDYEVGDWIVWNGGTTNAAADWERDAVPTLNIPEGYVSRSMLEAVLRTALDGMGLTASELYVVDRPDIAHALVAEDLSIITSWSPEGVETHTEREVHQPGSIQFSELAAEVTSALPETFDRPDLAYALVADDMSIILLIGTEGTLDATPGVDFISDVSQISEAARDQLGVGVKILGTPVVGELTQRTDVLVETGLNLTWSALPDLHTGSLILDGDATNTIYYRHALTALTGREYRGTWDAASGETPSPADAYEFRFGMWWLVSGGGTVDGVAYQTGDIIVYEALNDHTSEFPYEGAVAGLDGGDPAKRFRRIPSVDTVNEVYQRGTWTPAGGTPADWATMPDGACWECAAAGDYEQHTWAVGDRLVKDSGAEFGYRREATGPLLTLAPGQQTMLACSETASEWEIRVSSGVGPSMHRCSAVARQEILAYTVLDGGTKKVWVENTWTGQLNELTQLNSVGNNFDPQVSANRLFFTSDRSGSDEQYYAPLTVTPYGVDVEQVQPLRPNRLVYTGGDSMGFQFAGNVVSALDAYDTANSMPARSYHHAGRGSFDPYQITDRFIHWRALLQNGAAIGDGHLVVFLDRSFEAASKSEIFRLLSYVTSGIKRVLMVGLASAPTFAWDGATIVPDAGRGSSTFRSVVEFEDYFKRTFGYNYINARELLAGGAEPNPWFPGLSNAQAFAQHGYYAPRFCKNSVGSVAPIYHNNYAQFTADHFRGYVTAAPSVAGDEVLYDYHILRSGTWATLGDLYVWNGSAYEYYGFDRLHLYSTGYDLIAQEVADRFALLGWK